MKKEGKKQTQTALVSVDGRGRLFVAMAVADIGSAQARGCETDVRDATALESGGRERDACTFAARARGVAR